MPLLAAAKSEWESLSVEVPKMVEDIQARVDELTKKKRLPFGLNKDEFAEAKADFEAMKAQLDRGQQRVQVRQADRGCREGQVRQGDERRHPRSAQDEEGVRAQR